MELSVQDLKELLAGRPASPVEANCPWEIGEYYLIRTVTMIDTGRVVAVTPHEIVLEDAAWIADTGRFSDSLKDPSLFNEVEPYPDGRVLVGRGAIIEAARINKFNRSQK